ncbi:MAG: hypothetical protein PT118_07080 [Aphanizomenon gracile PMC644.10]|nr:hypothetical protein [Aphanizomenon gracile PMC644.10]
MTLATKNSINKNVAFEIEKLMVFLTPLVQLSAFTAEAAKAMVRSYTAVTRAKPKISTWKFQQYTTASTKSYVELNSSR